MKHLLITIVALLCTTAAMGQKGMHVAKLFDGRFRGNKAVTETHIKGAKLEKYDLDEYHSLTFKDDANTAFVESCVLEDAKKSVSKEVSYVAGKLYFGFYVFPAENYVYRYIFYLNNKLKNKDGLTVIYMEGEAYPSEVKKLLKK